MNQQQGKGKRVGRPPRHRGKKRGSYKDYGSAAMKHALQMVMRNISVRVVASRKAYT